VSTTAILIGVALVVIGIAGFVATGSTAKTALIPAYFGAILGVLGAWARNPARRKAAMHIAVVIALLGFLASFGRLVTASPSGAAAVSMTLMAALTGIFVVLAVKSFIDARRKA
jgi:hypothetical protein